MALSSLDNAGGRFIRANSYDRLDPSEKSAVSYFLGMAQAKITLHRIFGISHLAHLDPILEAAGLPRSGTRPDFIGVDPRSGTTSVAVEAKGRTNDWTDKLMEKAKEQVRELPSINGRPNTIEIASAAWFDTDAQWNARLVDPPRTDSQVEPISMTALFAGYYAPILGALVRAPALAVDGAPDRSSATSSSFALPDTDVSVEIDDRLLNLWRPVIDSAGQQSEFVLPSGTAGQLVDIASDLPAASESSDDAWSYRGPDGVTVHLGPSWQESKG